MLKTIYFCAALQIDKVYIATIFINTERARGIILLKTLNYG